MAANSNIQWTKHTWNPVEGCRKVSQGCKYCYAERLVERFNKPGQPKEKDFSKVRRTSAQTWNFPYKIHKKLTGQEPFTERLVFTCSMSDFFISEADEWRPEMWRIIRETPNLIYQILTKRPERVLENLPHDWGEGYPNVWIGVSTENQENFDLRVPILLSIPAKVRFLSIEPLIGEIDLTKVMESNKLDWVIIGGESGNESGKSRYRPCNASWIQYLTAMFQLAGVPVFVKQLGTYLAKGMGLQDKKGGDINEFPEGLRIRQWPKGYEGKNIETKPIHALNLFDQ